MNSATGFGVRNCPNSCCLSNSSRDGDPNGERMTFGWRAVVTSSELRIPSSHLRVNLRALFHEHFDVVGFLVRLAVMNEERFDRFLRRLLAVINGHVVEGRFARRGAASGFQVTP